MAAESAVRHMGGGTRCLQRVAGGDSGRDNPRPTSFIQKQKVSGVLDLQRIFRLHEQLLKP